MVLPDKSTSTILANLSGDFDPPALRTSFQSSILISSLGNSSDASVAIVNEHYKGV